MDEVSDEEWFHNAYYYFYEALNILAAGPGVQCDKYGHYNVAWELLDDVTAGRRLPGMPASILTAEESDAIAALVSQLKSVPLSVRFGAASPDRNLEAMRHPCWEPLRRAAADTIRALESATRLNLEYFQR